MTFLLPALVGGTGFMLGRGTKWLRWTFNIGLFRILLITGLLLSFVPLFSHLRFLRREVLYGWQGLSDDVVTKVVTATGTFTLHSFVLAAVLLVLGLVTVWRAPFLVSGWPLLLGFLYYLIPMDELFDTLLRNDITPDSLINIWLFWLSCAASAGLFGYTVGDADAWVWDS